MVRVSSQVAAATGDEEEAGTVAQTQVQAPEHDDIPGGIGRRHRGPGAALLDLLFRQGEGTRSDRTPDPTVPAWRPVAAGVVLALGGLATVALTFAEVELIDVVLAVGVTMFVAGLVDGTGRRYRGAGTGLMMVGVIPRYLDDLPASGTWFSNGRFLAVFLVLWGLYAAYRSWTARRADV